MMPNNLFVRLSKYRPTEETTPLENFFTELVREVLDRDHEARRDFLDVALAKGARKFLACEEVDTQVERRLGTYTRRFDLIISSGRKELFVENKVGSELRKDQLLNYLSYASERPDTRVVVASRDHNEIVEKARFKDDPRFVREILWGEVADRWEVKKQTYKCKCLVEGVLEFMEHYDMGPVRPFEAGEIVGAKPREGFHKKAKGMLIRLWSKLNKEPAWVKDGRFQGQGVYPAGSGRGHKNYPSYKGLLWYSPAEGPPDDADIWYFVGFRFGPPHKGLVQPLEPGQPECIAYVGVWRPEKVRGFMVEEAKRLSTGLSAPAFEVDDAENPKRVLLFRRKQLKDFIEETDQAAAILDFFEQSHKKLEAAVPKIHEAFRQGT